MRLPDDRSARNEEREVMEAGVTPRVGGVLRLVEEQLRPQRSIRPVVERSTGRGRKPLAKPEDGHELVVVLLGRSEIRNADPDVVDEAGSGHVAPPPS